MLKQAKKEKCFIDWLKSQRHRNDSVGQLGYALHEIGIAFDGNGNIAKARKEYSSYLSTIRG